jgi:hypothetical protein
MGRKQPIAEDIVAVTNGPYQSRRQRVAASRFDDDRTAVGLRTLPIWMQSIVRDLLDADVSPPAGPRRRSSAGCAPGTRARGGRAARA